MGKINYGRVILGGIVAGIIFILLDSLSNVVLLGQQWIDDAKLHNRPTSFSGPVTFGLILIEIVGGMVSIWIYAAIRPRFGPGVRTAIYTGLLQWAIFILVNTASTLQGIFGPRVSLYSNLLGLVSILLGTIAGARLYKEAESTGEYGAATQAQQATR